MFRMIHSFTSAGIIPSQYIHLSMFAGLGTVQHGYIRRGRVSGKYVVVYSIIIILVYNKNNYLGVVASAAEPCMESAVNEVKLLPTYSTNGEVSCSCYTVCINAAVFCVDSG